MTRWTQADVDRVLRKPMDMATVSEAKWNETKAKADAARSPSKYRNVKTGSYASKREAKRAQELKLLQQAGKIENLREQVEFVLIPKQPGERECKYVADFVYSEFQVGDGWEGWTPVVEDVKGYANAVYRIKKKLMLQVHGIRVRET